MGSLQAAASAPNRAEIDRRLTGSGGPFELETVRVGSAEVRIYKGAIPHLRLLLENSLAWGAREFLVYENERVTFERHFDDVALLAREFAVRYGVKKGDRIAIAMRNLPEWSVAF